MKTGLWLALAGIAFSGVAHAGAFDAANRDQVCGYLPYRADGPARFDAPRREAATAARIGPQATYPFAWDMARPAFLAAEVAEDLLAGRSVEAARGVHGGALSLGEYMIFAAKRFEAPPTTPETEDERVLLAAERPVTFHRIYVHSKESYEALVAHLTPDGPAPETPLEELALAWRPAYALAAKAQADDKRIELMSTFLDGDAVAEKEAVACLAHSVALLAGGADGAATGLAKAAAARWETRPAVNARKLPRSVRSAFFDYEDAGDDLAAAVAELPDGVVETAAMQAVAKRFAAFVTAAKSLHEGRRALAEKEKASKK